MTFCVLTAARRIDLDADHELGAQQLQQPGLRSRGGRRGRRRRRLDHLHLGARRQAFGRCPGGESFAHGADVRGRGAAAAADDAHAELERARREFPEVLGAREVDVAAFDELRQPGVRHHGHRRVAGRLHHLLQHLEARLRADAAVDAHHVRAGRAQRRDRLGGRVPVQRLAVQPEGHLGDHRHVEREPAQRTQRRRDLARGPGTSRAGSSRSRPRAVPPRPRRKWRSASATRMWPNGSSGLPSGPIEPATNAFTPTISRAPRAIFTPWRAMARVWSSRPCAARRTGLAPNVLVSISSAPAARYSRCSSSTSVGRLRFSSSKH